MLSVGTPVAVAHPSAYLKMKLSCITGDLKDWEYPTILPTFFQLGSERLFLNSQPYPEGCPTEVTLWEQAGRSGASSICVNCYQKGWCRVLAVASFLVGSPHLELALP